MYDKNLDGFIALAERLNQKAACDELGISQNALNKMILQLEETLQVKLFDKTRKELSLTRAGKVLLEDAKFMVRYANDVMAKIREAEEESRNTIYVGVSAMSPFKPFKAFLAKHAKKIPEELGFEQVAFINSKIGNDEIFSSLGNGIDIIPCCYDEMMLKRYQADVVGICSYPLTVLLSPGHPLAEKDALDIEDMYGEDLLIPEKGFNRCFDMLQEDLKAFHKKINLLDITFYDKQAFDRAKEGALLASCPLWEDFTSGLVQKKVLWNYSIKYGIVYSKQKSEKAEKFIKSVTPAPKKKAKSV